MERMKRRLVDPSLDCLGTYDEFKIAVRAVLNTTSTTTNFVEFGAFMTGTEEEVRETGFACKLRHSEYT
jgi:hypothetical protein